MKKSPRSARSTVGVLCFNVNGQNSAIRLPWSCITTTPQPRTGRRRTWIGSPAIFCNIVCVDLVKSFPGGGWSWTEQMISEREPFSPPTGHALLMVRREPSWRVGRASGLDETEVNFLLKDDKEEEEVDFCFSWSWSLSLSVLFSEAAEEMLQSSSCWVIKYFHSSEILKVTAETAPDNELVRSCCR